MPAPQVSLVSFATYVLVDAEGVLDSRRAFVSLALFSALRFPLAMLPFITSCTVQVGPDLCPSDMCQLPSRPPPGLSFVAVCVSECRVDGMSKQTLPEQAAAHRLPVAAASRILFYDCIFLSVICVDAIDASARLRHVQIWSNLFGGSGVSCDTV